MKHTIDICEQCPSCGGTGLYVGMGERDGAAVVCSKCNGTGCYHFKHEYEDFDGRKDRDGVKRVYEVNPGVCIGEGNGYTLERFGGMKYEDWVDGKPFPPRSENREFTCPCWWYQSANYGLKPRWDACMEALGTTFSNCRHFPEKSKCWDLWDFENGEE